MDKLIQYLLNEKEKIQNEIKQLEIEISQVDDEIKEIEEKIHEQEKGFDEIYELFSPNGDLRTIYQNEISRLRKEKIKCVDIKRLDEIRKNEDEKQLGNINFAIKEYKRMKSRESDLIKEVDNVKKKVALDHSRIYRKVMELINYIEKRNYRNLQRDILPIVRSLIRKNNVLSIKLSSQTIVDNTELQDIKNGFVSLEKQIDKLCRKEMFHVKHREDVITYDLIKSCELYFSNNKFKDEIVEFQHQETKIWVSEYQLENIVEILKEIIENAVQHGDSKNIRVKMNLFMKAEQQSQIFITVIEDGIGNINSIDMEMEECYGMKIINTRVELMNGTIKIENNKPHGNKIELMLYL